MLVTLAIVFGFQQKAQAKNKVREGNDLFELHVGGVLAPPQMLFGETFIQC